MKISHKFLVLLFLCLFMIGQVICPRYKIYAAKTTSVWQKVYWGSNSDIAYSIQQTTDGGYIVAGITNSFGVGDEDVYILKLDSNGNKQWEKTYGGSNDDAAYSIQQTIDGGYIVAGHTSSFGAGKSDVYILKLNSSGNKQWEKFYGGSNDDFANSIQQTADSGYIVVGATNSFGTGESDVYILKLDNSGNKQWERSYGGSNTDIAISIQQTTDGGYIVAGYTSSFGAEGEDIYIIKTDPLGDTEPYQED